MTIERIKVGPRMSQAVVHGATVYLAGQERALKRIEDALAKAGA